MGNSNSLHRYAFFHDQPENILFNSGYDTKTIIEKAIYRYDFEKYKICKNDKGKQYIYLSNLPKELLENCIFQNIIIRDYNENLINLILKNKNIKKCI